MKKIGYVLGDFPVLSETFVGNEIRAVVKRGHEVAPIVMRLREGPAQTDDRVLAQHARVLSSASAGSALRAFLSPGPGFASALWYVLRQGRQPRKSLMWNAMKIAAIAREEGCDHLHAHFATRTCDPVPPGDGPHRGPAHRPPSEHGPGHGGRLVPRPPGTRSSSGTGGDGEGEVDLIVRRGRPSPSRGQTRTTEAYGSGADAVGVAKQRRIRRLAAGGWPSWRRRRGRAAVELRFDVVSITADEVDVIEDAF